MASQQLCWFVFQEFTRADELYQAGMKVDPQNANLLVHRGIVALQSVGKSQWNILFPQTSNI